MKPNKAETKKATGLLRRLVNANTPSDDGFGLILRASLGHGGRIQDPSSHVAWARSI